MTTYAGSEPLEPFSVPAKILTRSASGGESPSPAAHRDSDSTGSNLPFHDLESPLGRVAVGVVLACAYVLVEANPAAAWVGVLLLLGCTLYRLDARQRRIAVAPVTFATLLLIRQMAQVFSGQFLGAAPVFQRPPTAPSSLPAPWLPLFFAVCLFYMPRYETCTGKIFTINAVLLLVSGLLPGYGFEAIFLTTQYFLFIAIVVGLAVDLTRHGSAPTAQASH